MELGINRTRFEITVGDKAFSLWMIPNLARYKAVQFFSQMAAMLEAMRINDAKERKAKIDEIGSDDEDEVLRDILSIILKANGYAYDKDWWDAYTDTQGQVEFIMLCLNGSEKNKKKLMETIGL